MILIIERYQLDDFINIMLTNGYFVEIKKCKLDNEKVEIKIKVEEED